MYIIRFTFWSTRFQHVVVAPKEELQSKLSAAEQSGDLQRQEQLALEAHHL